MKHSLANYPKQFLGCVVSPTKICLQFEDVQSKFRFKEGGTYVKLPDTSKALPIQTTGTQVDILAVGCQMPEIESLQKELLKAYLVYGKLHASTYQEVYAKDFPSFLISTLKELENVLRELATGGDSYAEAGFELCNSEVRKHT